MAIAAVSDVHRHEKSERLVAVAQRLAPLPTAVANPCDATSLQDVLEATITTILIGPQNNIDAVARFGTVCPLRGRKRPSLGTGWAEVEVCNDATISVLSHLETTREPLRRSTIWTSSE